MGKVEKKAERRYKKAKKHSGPDRNERLQKEFDRIQGLLDEHQRLKKKHPGAKRARKAGKGDFITKAHQNELRVTQQRIKNAMTTNRNKNRSVRDEFNKQGLMRGLGTRTMLTGGVSNATRARSPSVATTGTTLLRSS